MISTVPGPASGPITRRGLLASACGIAASAGASGLLSGCTGGGSTPAERNAGHVPLPNQTPFTKITPDLPGDQNKGISPGFFSYPLPAEQVQTVTGQVGSGGDLTNLVVTFSPPPSTMAKNAYWQAVNAALNVNLKSILVPDDFATKLAAVLAGNDLPDLITLYPADGWGLRRYESVVQAKFADLSDHLSGDAVQEYPNLARLPQDSWRPGLVNGRIFATPTLRIGTGGAVFCRSDLISKYGADPQPGNASDFEQLCQTFSDPDAKRWALANDGSWMTRLFFPMFGVPNGWRTDDGGGLTNQIETEEWKQAVGYIAETWRKGWWHPDSAGAQSVESDPLFANGTVALRGDNIVRYTVRGKLNFAVDLVRPFLVDGGPAQHISRIETDFLTFVKKGEEDRVRECLRVLNYLSAPLGSKENFLRTFGPEGTNHTIEDGRPTLTDRGEAETTALSLRFVAGGPDVLFASNGDADMVTKIHDYQTAVADHRQLSPTDGLFAESLSGTTQINQLITDTINDVVLGRKPIGALDEAVTKWRNGGGDKLREEYQEALAGDQ
ncbi:hypothetical protein [Microlunatus sp. GCM10028923]|uniref:hypothetical protein n=1 Tax=Microlunatus sp. GCM10028923 TaxID=3273400 RepID=UPI00360DA686